MKQQKKKFPYTVIGLLKFDVKALKKYKGGSGTFISKNHILTCAHNIYSLHDKKLLDI